MTHQRPLPKRLAGLDRWIIFNPARWPRRELISRVTALLIIAVFLGVRIDRFDRFPQSFQEAQRFYAAFKTLGGEPLYTSLETTVLWGIKVAVWSIETAIYLGYIAAYTGRARAVGIARGFMEVAFPVMVAGLPILISLMPYTLPHRVSYAAPSHMVFFLAVMGLIFFGGLINLIGLWTLRRAFTIMAEARILVTHGIFSIIRHPLYSAHFIIFLGSLLLRLNMWTAIIYLLFCIGQVVRVRLEERKLRQHFPGYAAYKESTGMFFPKL